MNGSGAIEKVRRGLCAVGYSYGQAPDRDQVCSCKNNVCCVYEIIKKDKTNNGCKQRLQTAQLTNILHSLYS